MRPCIRCLVYVAPLFLYQPGTLAQLPGCTPPPPYGTVIAYHGLTSGCSNLPGHLPCIAGETIVFVLGDGVEATTCTFEYIWDFGAGPTFGDPTQLHTFAAPGQYNVQLGVYSSFGVDHLSVTVPVVSPSAIPVNGSVHLLLMAGLLVSIGLWRLFAWPRSHVGLQ